MKNRLVAAVVAFSLAGTVPAFSQNSSDIFQQGLRKERVEGDLKAAIAIYRRLIQEHPDDRALVARALIQLGGAYERMGNSDARAAYERVIRDYPEQSTEATLARARLAALSPGTRSVARTEPTVRRVWAGPDVDVLGAPTQDGRLLTFVDWSTGDLAVRDLVTGENRRLTDKGPWTKSVAFALSSVPSPDGKHVAYCWFTEKQEVELRVVGMDGRNSRVLFTVSRLDYVQPWGWSPDGKQILTHVSRRDGTGQLAIVGVADSSMRILLTHNSVGPGKASFSPDGRYVAYDYVAGPKSPLHDIYLIRATGGPSTPIVSHPAQDLLLGWTPDGKQIVFESDRTGNMSLWAAPVTNGAASGDPELLRRDAEFTMVPMTINKDGAFYYASDASPTDLFIAAIEPGTGKAVGKPRRLLDRYVGENRNAAWSPDGNSIVYVSKRQPGPNNGTRILVVRTLATGAEKVLPVRILIAANGPHFAPDGSIVIRGGDGAGTSGIFRIDATTGAETLLLEVKNNGEYVGFTGQANSLVVLYKNLAIGNGMFVRHNLADSSRTDLYGYTSNRNRNVFGAVTSFDGRAIAFIHIDSLVWSIRVVSTEGGEAREIAVLPPGTGARNVAWSPDGRYLYYTPNRQIRDGKGGETVDSENQPVMRVPVEGGKPEATGIVGDEIRGLRISPDGTQITYTAGRSRREVWVMENFLKTSRSR